MDKKLATGNGTEILRLASARCNVMIVSRKGRSIMVDSGMPSDRSLLKWAIGRLEAKPEAVVLTHSHFDHAANAAWLKREYGMKVVIHSSEAENLAAGKTNLPSGTFAVTRFLISIGRRLPSWFSYEKCTPDMTFSKTVSLDEFGIDGQLIHTPGHSIGELAVIINNELAICGDSIMGVIPGRVFPIFADDIGDTIKAWKTLLDTGCSLFIPGHGRPVKREILEKEYRRKKR